MITRDEFIDLYEKRMAGSTTPAENALLESYMDQMKLADNTWDDDSTDQFEAYQRIWKKLQESRFPNAPTKKNYPYNWIRIAAAIFLVSAAIWIFLLPQPQSSVTLTQKNTPHSAPLIKPGGNKAMLTLANGSSIVLNEAHNGELTTQSGVQVTKTRDGMLVYRSKQQKALPKTNEINMITTPRGGQYHLVLNDGTRVWLNSASVLKFPAQFHGKERRVELEGEAYFEVHKDPSSPFIVHTSGQEVKVLGTHFNVKAYADEAAVRTSLLEGRVNVLSAGKITDLRPGFEAVNDGKSVKVREADVEQSIAWKNGSFQFNKSSIEDVMLQISRWYDVSIVTPNQPLPVRQFTGTISRQASIQEVLEMLRYTGVKFSTRNKEILVER